MNTRVSELEAEHRALGAGLDDWNGMDVAWSYATSAEKEHDAVREAAGLFDVSGLKKVWIKGPDALAVVEKIATRDMSRIYKGKSAYCPLLTDAGTICDDNIIFHVDDNKYLYVCLLYTSDAADDLLCVDLGGRRIIKKKKEEDDNKKIR